MSTAGQQSRKKVVHPYDPLDDLDAEVHQGKHTQFIIEDSSPVHGPGFWADWVVQTTDLTALSDRVEAHGGTRFCTIQAVILGGVEDALLVTDKNGDRFRIPASTVRLDNVQTTRH